MVREYYAAISGSAARVLCHYCNEMLGSNMLRNMHCSVARKMIILFIFMVTICIGSNADKCPGYKQNLVVPADYIKYLPDSLYTGNVSQVQLLLIIKRIKMVKEER